MDKQRLWWGFGMGRPERVLDPDAGPLERFACELRRLRTASGGLSYRELSRRAHFSVTALSEAAGGDQVPSLAVTLAYVQACGGDRKVWEQRWQKLVAQLAALERSDGLKEGQNSEAALDAPYLGLATFEPEDTGRFFGRERSVAELCARLDQTPFLAVFGASGVGKSSVLRAGLIPALRDGRVQDGVEWAIVLMVPGEHPIEALVIRLANLKGIAASSLHSALIADPDGIRLTIRQVLADRSGSPGVLIMVDQFEEIFTLCRDECERERFIALLLAAAREPAARVVLGVRADFYARCAEHAALVAALDGHQVLLGPMDDDDLRSVITGPARHAGIKVDAELIEAVVADAHNQPGALPLVSHALLETWRRRKGASMTPAGYRAAGGMRSAIAQTAERVHGEFSEEQQHIAEAVFLRLTAFGDGTEDTRRRAPRAELLGGADGRDVEVVLDRLVAARLVTADRDAVTVAHEALIRNWPRLRSWLAEDRDLLRAHRRLTEAAAEWEQHGRDEELLYRGTRLASWDDRPRKRLNGRESAFLEASRARVARDRRSRLRRVRLALAALGTALVVMSVLAAFALIQADRAAHEQRLALSRQLAAEARTQLQLNPQQGLRTARRAYQLSPTSQAEAVLRQALVDSRMLKVLPGNRERALGVAFSADGRLLADTSNDGTVRVSRWSGGTVSGEPPLVLRGHRREAWSPAFSPDGRRLATAGVDGTVRVFTIGAADPLVLRGHKGPVWNVAFSPDGRHVASAGDDGTVRIWNASVAEKPVVFKGHKGVAVGVAFSPDGRHVASGGHDGTVRIWDYAGHRRRPQVLRGHEGAVKTVKYSPDGTLLASASIDGTARVWDIRGKKAPVVLHGHDGTVEGLVFSPDGTRLATTSDDTTIRVWNPQGDIAPLVLRGHTGTVWSAAFSPDGSRLASASSDGTVRIWDPRGPGDPDILGAHDNGEAWTTALSGNGRRIVSGGVDGTVRVWDTHARTRPRVLRGHQGQVFGVAADSTGRRVVSASADGTVRVWDTTGTADPLILRGHHGTVWSVALSPDGRRIASAGDDGTLRIWNAEGRGRALVRTADATRIRTVVFSPDGSRVATGGQDGTVRVWDLTGAADPLILRGHGGLVFAVAFAPDNRHLVSGGDDGTVRVWDLTGAADPLILRGHQGFVWSVATSPDGQWIASTGKDATVRVWKADTVTEPVVLSGFQASVEGLAFHPDSHRLVTTHGDGTVRLWRCDTCAPASQILKQTTP